MGTTVADVMTKRVVAVTTDADFKEIARDNECVNRRVLAEAQRDW